MGDYIKGDDEEDEFAVDSDGLNRWGRKSLDEALAKPWSELIWTIRQCDPQRPFGLNLLQRAYAIWRNDPSVNIEEYDECRVMLARALAVVGRDVEALELLQLAIAARENGTVTKGEPPSLILLRIAQSQARVESPVMAVETVRRALAAQPDRHFFYNDRARAYGLLAKLLGEVGDDDEAQIAGAMDAAWSKLASASALTMRDAPEAGLSDAQAAREMMIAAVGNAHGDLGFADHAISDASADLGA